MRILAFVALALGQSIVRPGRAGGAGNGRKKPWSEGLDFEAAFELHAQFRHTLRFLGATKELLTHPVQGLENFAEMIRLLTEEKNAIKVFVEISKEG